MKHRLRTAVLVAALGAAHASYAQESAALGDGTAQDLLKLLVDEDILGGVKLRIGDKIADASVRHRLEMLRARLAGPMARLEGSVETAS